MLTKDNLTVDALNNAADTMLATHRDAIEQLKALDVGLGPREVSSSHIVVTYPPKQVLDQQANATLIQRGKAFEAEAVDPTDKKWFNPFTAQAPSDQSVRPRALYLHIPFCTGICSYCGFTRTANGIGDPIIDEYLTALEKEAALVHASLGGEKVPVDSIYIGGGTPSMLTHAQLERLFKIIDTHYALKPGGEYTLESSPETIAPPHIVSPELEKILKVSPKYIGPEKKVDELLTPNRFELARKYGVNRVSMGVESFNEEILKNQNRRHDVQTVYDAVALLRDMGIDNIDIDLMRGLPGYTDEMVAHDLEHLKALNIPSITDYQFVPKDHSVDKKRGKTWNDASEKHHAMYMVGLEALEYAHADPIIDVFTKGQEHGYQHNIQKWSGGDLIALGAGSYGNVGNVQYINHENVSHYMAAMNANDQILPIQAASALSPEEHMRRDIVLGLKLGIDRAAFKAKHGVDPLESVCADMFKKIIDAGGIEVTPNTIKMSRAGELYASAVQTRFYSPEVKERTAFWDSVVGTVRPQDIRRN